MNKPSSPYWNDPPCWWRTDHGLVCPVLDREEIKAANGYVVGVPQILMEQRIAFGEREIIVRMTFQRYHELTEDELRRWKLCPETYAPRLINVSIIGGQLNGVTSNYNNLGLANTASVFCMQDVCRNEELLLAAEAEQAKIAAKKARIEERLPILANAQRKIRKFHKAEEKK
jgi:hypothetical protein